MAYSQKNPLYSFFKFLYGKLFAINDTPQRIAIGVGIGVFFGVFPGLGPFAALSLAVIFKVNRAGALLGSLLTNTWMSIPVFLIAAWLGSVLTGSSYASVRKECAMLVTNFSWGSLVKISAGKVFLPIMAGYIMVSAMVGIIAYLIALYMAELIAQKKLLIRKDGNG